MDLLIYASTRNRKKLRKICSITSDFGLVQIASKLFIGSAKKKYAEELKTALSSTLHAKTDVLIISSLCSNCARKIKHNNKAIRQININRFEKDFEIY